MMITDMKEILNSTDFIKLKDYKGYDIYFNGLLFMLGKKAGKESVHYLLDKYLHSKEIPFNELYGAFTIVIKDPSGNITAFSDNSNMHCFYHTEKVLSSSFLDLVGYISQNNIDKLHFNEEAVTEFYTLGTVYFNKTFFKEINVIDSSKYITITDQGVTIFDKHIGNISGESTITDPLHFLKDIAYSISDTKVSIGLTGGYDSRMLFAGINDYTDITPTISGNNESAKDIIISKKIAQITDKELHVVKTEQPTVSRESIINQFKQSDGMLNYINDARYRWTAFQDKLIEHDFRYHLSGDGGVLHKDWQWQQDLPFYNSTTVDLKKYYRQRISNQYNDKNIGSKLSKISERQEARFIEQMEQYKRGTNTQTYDFLYNYVHGNNKFRYNISTKDFTTYAPLQELDWVSYSYKLPRKERFFANHIRKNTTKANKEIARLKTDHGTTASSEPGLVLKDSFIEVYNYFIKALRLMGRKVFNRTYFIGNVITWSTYEDMKKLTLADEAINYCIAISFIDSGSESDDLSKHQLGAVIHIYLLAKKANLIK